MTQKRYDKLSKINKIFVVNNGPKIAVSLKNKRRFNFNILLVTNLHRIKYSRLDIPRCISE